MGGKRYYTALGLVLLNLAFLVPVMNDLEEGLFLRELLLYVLFIIMGATLLYTIYRNLELSMVFSAAYFATIMLNSIYLYISQVYEYSIMVLALVGVYGFVSSLFHMEKPKKVKKLQEEIDKLKSKSKLIEKELKTLEKTKPQIIFDDKP